jgi:hypothetical protein
MRAAARPDLLRRLKAPLGHALLQLLKSDAPTVRRFAALSKFKCLEFFGMDGDDSHAGLV